MLGFTFESDWLRKWRVSSGPIRERSKAKGKQSQTTFDFQMNIALNLSMLATNKKSFFQAVVKKRKNNKITHSFRLGSLGST